MKQAAVKAITVLDVNKLQDNERIVTKQFIITKRGLRYVVNRTKDSHIHAFNDSAKALAFANGDIVDVAITDVPEPASIVKTPGLAKAESAKQLAGIAPKKSKITRRIGAFFIYILFMLIYLAFGWFYFVSQYYASIVQPITDSYMPVISPFISYGLIGSFGIVLAVLAAYAGKKLDKAIAKTVLLSINGAGIATAIALYIVFNIKANISMQVWFADIVSNIDILLYFVLFAISEVIMAFAKRKHAI